jgi:hypothetical protein
MSAGKPACPDAGAAPALAANWALLSDAEARTAAALLADGQAHLFASWPPPGERDADKKRLLVQARRARRAGRQLRAGRRCGALRRVAPTQHTP